MTRDKLKLLTPAERLVFYALAQGMSNKEAGQSLHISSRTVENHRAKIVRKLGISFTGFLFAVMTEAGIEL